MSGRDLTLAFTVEQSAEQVFQAVTNVRGWWSEQIVGDTDRLGATFDFRHQDIHRSRHTITELVPGKKVVWHTTDSEISYVEDHAEWTGTDVVFEIAERDGKTELRFTHVGLRPSIECYGECSGAWGMFVTESLRSLITTGKGQPLAKPR
jgi:hypothetical protein